MLLKLLLPHYNDMVKDGLIGHWHKAEGEYVAFGEDLFDLKVERVRVTPLPPFDVSKQIESLVKAQAAARCLADEQIRVSDVNQQPDSQVAIFHMRVTSSDQGILRKIYAKEGEQRQIGDLLALLSTDDSEPLGDVSRDSTRAGIFRVVANMI